jgi:peptidoglycan/LPS O-acetylase OafA/YrhL
MAYAPLWSVSVEEQFYLVWPWLIRFVSEKRLLIVGVALIVAAPWVREIRFEFGHTTHPLQWYNTFAHLDSFGAGVVACLAYRSGQGVCLQKHLTWVAFVVLAGLCALQIGTGTMNNFPDLTVIGHGSTTSRRRLDLGGRANHKFASQNLETPCRPVVWPP